MGLKAVAMCAFAAAIGSANAQTVMLTGINWYTLDSGHQYTGGYANTYGGDTYSRNLYVTENQTVGFGALLNSQNLTTLPTRVAVNVGTTGTYNFEMYCNDESTVDHAFWGLNLFFNQDDRHPWISVHNVVNVDGFQAQNPVGTPTLDPFSMGLVQEGSSNGVGPVYVSGNIQVQLTAFHTWSANHYNVDRVDNFTDNGGHGNGTKDDVIEFTLQVTSVPEPASIAVLGVASLIAIRRRRARALRN
ncbi:MAG TPA: PEP-CTERM sorting domain-containing protein [Fimbriimonadaceae bacterium]|nr:PEP-CTERM sorting domain-containing protein [Fimbriimonadaceae bacterium]